MSGVVPPEASGRVHDAPEHRHARLLPVVGRTRVLMPAEDMPAAEVDVGPEVVRALLAEQHPDLADLDLVELAYGWDNAMYRLGDELTVRVPRRAMAAALVEHEQ